jgi:peroxiredoxin
MLSSRHLRAFALFALLGLGRMSAQIVPTATDVSPLLIGEVVPDASLKDPDGRSVKLSEVLAKQPTVLVLYRGGWCPYCNMHLAALGKVEQEILSLGYQIVAISPEDYQNLKPIIATDEIQYQVYSDPGAKLIQAMGLAFATPDNYLGYLAKVSKGEISTALPVPTLMVLNPKAEIMFEYINPTYTQRISPELLLAVLKSLK